jgi:tetratricopeptide (TPR) repeat protein
MRSEFVIFSIIALLAIAPSTALAHGDIGGQIAALGEQIAKDPTNPAHYLRRGGLHRIHEDFDLALADYERAAQLDPSLDATQLAKGQLLFEAGWSASARAVLDAYIARNTQDATARLIRARVLSSLGHYLAAAEDYTHAIHVMKTPTPDYYLECANALAALGGNYIGEAIACLDEGIGVLGPLITLQVAALDLEIKHERHAQSLARLDTLVASSPRKDKWLAKRGAVLEEGGWTQDAHEAYKQALHAITALTSRQQNTKATRELKTNLLSAIERSAAKEAISSKTAPTIQTAVQPAGTKETKYEQP